MLSVYLSKIIPPCQKSMNTDNPHVEKSQTYNQCGSKLECLDNLHHLNVELGGGSSMNGYLLWCYSCSGLNIVFTRTLLTKSNPCGVSFILRAISGGLGIHQRIHFL